MIYNERCNITTKTAKPGFLGDDEEVSNAKTVPCAKTSISASEQVDALGAYSKSAFKLHLRGIHEKIDEIEFQGSKRNIFDLKYHRNSTVVIVK